MSEKQQSTITPTLPEESYTVWERLEPVARDEAVTRSLRAEVRDPAWLLARQWQMGEFRGNDGGSPVAVDLEYVQERLSSVTRQKNHEPVDYDPGNSPPLETVVEREQVLTDDDVGPDYRVRVEAGMNFLERVRSALPSQSPKPGAFPERFHVDMDGEPRDDAARRFERVVGGERALDGYEVFQALDSVPGIDDSSPDWQSPGDPPLPLPDDTANGGGVPTEFGRAARAFHAWYQDLYAEPDPASGDAWDENRMEYVFDTTTSAGDAETTFTTSKYTGDGLEWDDFHVDDTTTGDPSVESLVPAPTVTAWEHAEDQSVPESVAAAPTPTRIQFSGMPPDGYWEMADANVDLSTLSAAPEDVSWLTMAEIALTAGYKWFAVPLEAAYGTLTRITEFEVVDTFAEHPLYPPDDTEATTAATTTVEAETPAVGGDGKGWNAYLHDLPDKPEPGLFLPPVLGTSLRSDPVERVRFSRDESANLVFAIENLVEGPLGSALDREEFDRPRLRVAGVEPDADPDAEYVEFRNEGDDVLARDGWRLRATVAQGPFQFQGARTSGETVTVETVEGLPIDPDSTVRLYTGGADDHDTGGTPTPG